MPSPSLRALKAFAETARTGTLAGAARALNVTPSAVSHLLRDLEQTLSVALFSKGSLTQAGQTLGRQLISGFDTIDQAVAETQRQQTGDVRVSALSSFLTLWLVPRLSGFQTRHPGTRLLLTTGLRPVDLATEPFECAIRWGTGNWPGLEKTLLFRDQPVMVTNPRFIGKTDLPRLAAHGRPDDWPQLGAALGLPDIPPALTFETRALAVQAAIAGMGAAVVDRNLVTGLLRDGLLAERAPDPPVIAPQGHWFVALPRRLRLRPVQQFHDWLVAEANQPV